MRTIVIGDVHGMLDELRALVDKLDLRDGDRLFFLGDLVDKGPDSLGVVRFVRDLGATVVCGNHEESAIRLFDKAQKAGSWDGLRKVEKEPWLRDLDSETVDWLRTLPLFVRPMDGVILVHGGFFPALFDKFDALPSASPEDWHRGGGKTMDRLRRVLRIRHVFKPGSVSTKGKDISGQMVQLGDEGESTEHWANWWDGREGFAIFGHDPQRNGRALLHLHALALDTGAVFGGRLTAAVIERHDTTIDGVTNFATMTPGGPIRVQLVSVECSKHAEWLDTGE